MHNYKKKKKQTNKQKQMMSWVFKKKWLCLVRSSQYIPSAQDMWPIFFSPFLQMFEAGNEIIQSIN